MKRQEHTYRVILVTYLSHLSNSHLLDHVGLARSSSTADAAASASLLLKDLPEL